MLFDILKSAFRAIVSSLEYQNEYGAICITEKGEKVKSRSEKRIADYLYRNNIQYEYEKPAFTRGWIFHDKIANPDFYLPEYDVYIEYWGLVDAKNNHVRYEYTRIMKWKMAQYHQNKIKFMSLYPNNMENLDWVFKAKLKEATGIDFRGQIARSDVLNKLEYSTNPLDSKVIKLLGKYQEKIVVIHDQNGINLRQKSWLKKEEWNDINDILSANGFRWQSKGKASCWLSTNWS